MITKLRQYISWWLLGFFTIILIVACDRSFNSLESDPTVLNNLESCRLVSHEMGKTEVCGQPQKVLALSPHILDIILALGVQPTGLAQNVSSQIQTYDNPPAQIPYLGRWVTTEPVGVGSRGTPSLERIKLLQPDLILGESFFQQNLYPLLTQIAPTLLFDDLNNPNEIQSWKQDIDGIAEALGREEQVEELLKTHDQQIAQARTALQPVLQTYPRVFVMSSNLGATYIASRPESAVSRLLQEIGFEIVRPSGFPERYVAISQEVIPQVETDLIIVTTVEDNVELNTEDSKPQATMREKWAQNPLLSSMPVFQQGRVFFVDYYLWNGVSRGPLSDQLILEALPDLLLPIVQ